MLLNIFERSPVKFGGRKKIIEREKCRLKFRFDVHTIGDSYADTHGHTNQAFNFIVAKRSARLPINHHLAHLIYFISYARFVNVHTQTQRTYTAKHTHPEAHSKIITSSRLSATAINNNNKYRARQESIKVIITNVYASDVLFVYFRCFFFVCMSPVYSSKSIYVYCSTKKRRKKKLWPHCLK